MERTIANNLITFYFPFSYRQKEFKPLTEKLQAEGYTLFKLNNEDESDLQHELDQFFYPFIQEKLFPETISEHSFNRFCRSIDVEGNLQTRHRPIPFVIERLDVTICPFEIGILSLLIKLKDEQPLSDAIDFMRDFRQLMPEPTQKKYLTITVGEQSFSCTQELLYDYLLPFLPSFFEQNNTKSGYMGSLPYFEDERMYTTCLFFSDDEQEIDMKELYRLAHLDGRCKDGTAKISSYNDEYIDNYVTEHSYERWAPYLYVTTTMQSHISLSNIERDYWQETKLYYISTGFYNILIHYFYKIVLLKLSYEHSEISWRTDKVIAEKLSEKITLFYSKYYFNHVAIRSSGRDLSRNIRKQMRIDELFVEVKQSVNDLYRVLENENQDRYNQLLFILTVYTVISGIIGMNLVVEDWDQAINWGSLDFSFFEWVAFITGISGIWLSFALIVGAIIRFVINYVRKRKH
ncbi:MAG: sugar phosphate isomerase [Lysinibacillus sp.]